MTDGLEQFIFGRASADGQPTDNWDVLALSSDLTPEDTRAWRALVSLEPMTPATAQASQAVGIFDGPGDDYLLARAHHQQDDPNWPVYQYVRLPKAVYQPLTGCLERLIDLVSHPILPAEATQAAIQPLTPPSPPTMTVERRAALFALLLQQYGAFDNLLALLGAALSDRKLLIRGVAENTEQRVILVQGLMMLLPAVTRPQLTFSTNTFEPAKAGARLVFSDTPPENGRQIADFSKQVFPATNDESLYLTTIAALWQGDTEAFFEALEPMETIAPYMIGENLNDSLNQIAERFALDRCALAGEDIPVDKLKAMLNADVPMSRELQICYATPLLHHALQERDTEAASIVMRFMDNDPEVDEALNKALNAALEDQPDSVYVCIRTRLRETVDERWLPRLQAAALRSLDVALKDADSETLASWLELISREPDDYGLGDLLHEGIVAALNRAREDGDLGSRLLVLAMKYDLDLIDRLLDDAEFMAALPEPFGPALRESDPEALVALREQGRRPFLIGVHQAVKTQAKGAFTSDVVATLWDVYVDEVTLNMPESYQAEAVIKSWTEIGIDWLSTDALETLLALMVSGERDDLFYQLAHHLGEHEVLFPMLASVFQASGRSVTAILGLIGQLVTAGDITQQEAVNTYVNLLAAWDWQIETLPLVEQMVRMIQQSPTLTLTSEVGWRLLSMGATANSELVARVASRRLLTHLESLGDEAELVDHLLRLYDQVQWSQQVRLSVMNWWRDFARSQPLANLQRIDKALSGVRQLDEARDIVQTAIALRKMMGTRSLEQFAADITTTHKLLQAFVDSFDPTPKQSLNFDQPTVRAMLDTHEDELTIQERKLLAKNLKELAQLVTLMAEHRTKVPLMRREEDFERQLSSGEQKPHGAVDTMKWMSGYLDGIQENGEENDEK